MVDGKLKSRRFRRVSVKTPGGKTVRHYRKRKPTAAKCAIYGTVLAGVPKARPSIIRNMPKSQRRPDRPYGGVLGSRGMRDVIKAQAREESGESLESDSTDMEVEQ